MSALTTQKLTTYFKNVKSREKVPYEYWDMVAAVRKSSLKQDSRALEQLLYSMEESWCRLNPNPEQPEQILRAARDQFLTLVYLADHCQSPTKWIHLESLTSYARRECYGKTMNITYEIFKKRGIDLVGYASKEYCPNFSSS